MNQPLSLDDARRRDAADGLRAFREQFAIPRDAHGAQVVYLCGHSLGLMPLAARARVAEELDDWANLAVLGHESALRPWIQYHRNLAGGLEALTGAAPDEVIAMNSLTVNLHLMLAAFYRPAGRRTRILIEAGAFPSDRHAVLSHIARHGLAPETTLVELGPSAGSELVADEAIAAYLDQHGAQVALILWPGVQYLTGQAFDLNLIARAGRRAGCRVGFDLGHAIGNMPLCLHDDNADFAVWCSYKFLNAGPGAIGGCFVHEQHAGLAASQRLAGWWGHEARTRFLMRPDFLAEAGAPGWAVSNPPILSAAPLLASLDTFAAAGLDRLRAKSVALSGFLEQLLAPLAPTVKLITPHSERARGCQLSLRIAGDGRRCRRVFERLLARSCVCDWREPDTIRIAAVPLYNRFEDAWQFAEELAAALREIV